MSAPTATRRSKRSLACKRGEPTWEIAALYPPQGYWSEAEYLDLNTNHLIEFVDGCLEFLPMPTLFHQAIVLFLFSHLSTFVREHGQGEVVVAPCRVHIAPDKYREPDVIYIRSKRVRNRHRPLQGADLVMEVVSGTRKDRKRDLKTKREEYARARIPEYWIVDPQKRRITVLTLDGTVYREHGTFSAGSRATSALFPGFSVSVDEVFAAGEGKI